MQVKMIKNFKVNNAVTIQKGTVLPVRIFVTAPLQFNAPIQVIDGPHSGEFIPREACIEVKDEDKVYSEKEWADLKNFYADKLIKENGERHRAQQLVRELTEQVKLKNKEITKLEFFLNALRQTLILFAFQNKKEMEYEK